MKISPPLSILAPLLTTSPRPRCVRPPTARRRQLSVCTARAFRPHRLIAASGRQPFDHRAVSAGAATRVLPGGGRRLSRGSTLPISRDAARNASRASLLMSGSRSARNATAAFDRAAARFDGGGGADTVRVPPPRAPHRADLAFRHRRASARQVGLDGK